MNQTEKLPYPYLVIEGNIGSGKTTLCHQFQEKYGARLILEQFSDNPFLPLFYENPERHAFSVELFFMTERHRQLQEELIPGNLFDPCIISDYVFPKTLLFARNNLQAEEYRLFQRLFQVLNAHFRKPDLLIYLHRPIEVLLSQIAKRGRTYEREIRQDYLLEIQQAYIDFFRVGLDYPVVVAGLGSLDFERNSAVFDQLDSLLHEHFTPGLHYRDLLLQA